MEATTVSTGRPLPDLCDPSHFGDLPPRDRAQIHSAWCAASFISILLPAIYIKAGKIGYEILCIPAFCVTVWGVIITCHIRSCNRPIPRPGVTVRLPPPPVLMNRV
jgi:hypothetical protein